MKITDHPLWNEAVARTSKLFTGTEGATAQVHKRDTFYLQLLHDHGVITQGKHIVDLGAGLCWFDTLLRALGPQVTLVDDYGGGGGVDKQARERALETLDAMRRDFDIRVEMMDFLNSPLPFEDASVDAVTCFHSLEHWHHSPKALFAEIWRVMRPGGHALFATPNAANIRKRITVLFGGNNWSPLEEWYHEPPPFRGHVREPVLRDLHRLFEWNGFRVVASHGRNFIGRESHVLSWLPAAVRHSLAEFTETVLRWFPTLCSDLHIVAQKPA